MASDAEDEDDLAAATRRVRECPRNAQMRHDLALAHERSGDLRSAVAEARTAKQLVSTYGRAFRTLQRLEPLVDATDDDAAYIVPLTEAEAPARWSGENWVDRKRAGNEFFLEGDYDAAIREYSAAIDTTSGDAKLLSNRAAAYLKLGKNVRAANDARASLEADCDWWKGHWYLGQALLALLRQSKHRVCTANGERAQEAFRALDNCLKCSTLPPDKRPTVQDLRDRAQAAILGNADAADCRLM
mmetsp:Transcript_29156/g.89177  ORF Transcript_29156/g.89177 Transcript_29156/m.89177 type:complete len:244 (-) Transcript_29156:990-1721(-)